MFVHLQAGDGRQEELRVALVQLRALLAEGDVPGGAPPAHSQLAWASAWQLIWDDRQLRQSAKLAPQSAPACVAKWLVKAVDKGLVTRQEVVSMCPVALLQVDELTFTSVLSCSLLEVCCHQRAISHCGIEDQNIRCLKRFQRDVAKK
jgi:hypothetical protein